MSAANQYNSCIIYLLIVLYYVLFISEVAAANIPMLSGGVCVSVHACIVCRVCVCVCACVLCCVVLCCVACVCCVCVYMCVCVNTVCTFIVSRQ